MKLVGYVKLGLILGLIPCLLGQYFVEKEEGGLEPLFKRYIYGLGIMFALFEGITVPLTFLKGSLTMVNTTFLAICGVLILFGVINRKLTFNFARIKLYRLSDVIVGCMSVVIIFFQTFYVVTHMHTDKDDAWYVGTATTSYFTDTLNLISPYTGDVMKEFPADYVLSPFPIFYAM